MGPGRRNQRERTIHACVVWLDMGFLDSAVLNDESITLGAITAKDGSTVKVQIKGPGKG